jgi:hypothetical protein
MKALFLNSIIFFSILIFFTSCMGSKSPNVVIIESKNKMFSAGEPVVVFKSYGAILDYFSPGAIIVCKVDYPILKQPGLKGTVYRIDKDSKLVRIESLDTALSNMEIAEKYIYTKSMSNDSIVLDEISLIGE